MPRGEGVGVVSARPDRRGAASARPSLALTAATYAALLATIFPLFSLLEPGPWVVTMALISAFVLAVGFGLRWMRTPTIVVIGAQLVAGVLALTTAFFSQTAAFGIFPTVASVQQAIDFERAATAYVMTSYAPLSVTEPLAFVLTGAGIVLAIVLDYIVQTARMAVAAAVAMTAVWLIPALVAPGPVNVAAFVLLALAILLLFRLEARQREVPVGEEWRGSVAVAGAGRTNPGAAVGSMAMAIAAGAVAIAVAVSPGYADAVVRPGDGSGGSGSKEGWNMVSASLAFGDDLRRDGHSDVLTYSTTAVRAPYLRMATLTNFDGEVWHPDRGGTAEQISVGERWPGPAAAEDVQVDETRTWVSIVNLVSVWAPVPYAATSVEGLSGQWMSMRSNDTIFTDDGSTHNQRYTVDVSTARPTLEQIREAPPAEGFDDARALPENMPPNIAELAREVTAGTDNSYDAMATLQRWFRSQFSYSLESPVEQGFDGSGAEALSRFLEVREGYCIHFSAAFALMARTLDMPARVVVGYLPGSSTAIEDGRTVYTITAEQLHAWPEVYFEGVGWVPFEPTATLGTATSFAPGSTTPGETEPDLEEPEVSEPTAAPTVVPEDPSTGEGAGSDAADDGSNLLVRALWVLLVLAGAVLVLAVPGLVQEWRRRQLLEAAARGDARAAWRYVQDAAIDHGVVPAVGESARAFGARLALARHGAPSAAVDELVAGIELASYGRLADAWYGDDLSADARAVRSGLAATVPPAQRWIALALPRSLVTRPPTAPVRAG